MQAILTFVLLFLSLASAAHGEARVKNLEIKVEGSKVAASFRLQDGFHRRLRERVESGLPTSIVYQFELHRDRKRWYDRRLKANTLEVVAIYDAVAREYMVNYKLDDKLVESRTVRDKQALAEAMTHVGPLPIFTLDDLPRSWRLLVKVRAELGSRMVLALVPVTIGTDWKESKKFRSGQR